MIAKFSVHEGVVVATRKVGLSFVQGMGEEFCPKNVVDVVTVGAEPFVYLGINIIA